MGFSLIYLSLAGLVSSHDSPPRLPGPDLLDDDESVEWPEPVLEEEDMQLSYYNAQPRLAGTGQTGRWQPRSPPFYQRQPRDYYPESYERPAMTYRRPDPRQWWVGPPGMNRGFPQKGYPPIQDLEEEEEDDTSGWVTDARMPQAIVSQREAYPAYPMEQIDRPREWVSDPRVIKMGQRGAEQCYAYIRIDPRYVDSEIVDLLQKHLEAQSTSGGLSVRRDIEEHLLKPAAPIPEIEQVEELVDLTAAIPAPPAVTAPVNKVGFLRRTLRGLVKYGLIIGGVTIAASQVVPLVDRILSDPNMYNNPNLVAFRIAVQIFKSSPIYSFLSRVYQRMPMCN